MQKKTNLEDLRHSESASDFLQYLYILCKEKVGILGIGPRIFLLRSCNLCTLFLRYLRLVLVC